MYARRKAGHVFYNLILPWETDDKEKYPEGCFSITGGGLVHPSQKIEGEIESSKSYKFNDLWTTYYSFMEGYYHHYKCS